MPNCIETKALNFHFGFFPEAFKWTKGEGGTEQEEERTLRNRDNRVCFNSTGKWEYDILPNGTVSNCVSARLMKWEVLLQASCHVRQYEMHMPLSSSAWSMQCAFSSLEGS